MSTFQRFLFFYAFIHRKDITHRNMTPDDGYPTNMQTTAARFYGAFIHEKRVTHTVMAPDGCFLCDGIYKHPRNIQLWYRSLLLLTHIFERIWPKIMNTFTPLDIDLHVRRRVQKTISALVTLCTDVYFHKKIIENRKKNYHIKYEIIYTFVSFHNQLHFLKDSTENNHRIRV